MREPGDAGGTDAATLDDVAAAAGVHAATVSRALNRPDLVADDTRRRVDEAIEELGYEPNPSARRLAGGPAGAMAMLVPDVVNPYFSVLVEFVQRRAAETGKVLLLMNTARDPATELDSLRRLARSVDGFVICSPVNGPHMLVAATGSRPYVLVNRTARGCASVTVDQAAVVAVALSHLRGLGHDRIGVVRGPNRYWSARERDGAVLADGSLTLLGPAAPTFDGGHEVFGSVRASRVTGVVAFNDLVALGIMAAASERGVGVPGELSVIGSDGISLGAMVTPALTTVAAPLETIATRAVDLVSSLIAGGTPDAVVLQPSLLVRASTEAPVRGARGRR